MPKNIRDWLTKLTAATLLLIVSPAFAQEQQEKKAEPAAASTHVAASPSKPGPEQAFLAKRAGEYTRAVKFVGQPGANAMAFTGTSRISVVLDGRFIQEENNDVVFGKPVTGLRLWGYNNVTKQYEAAWTYTMSTAILMLTGTSNDGGKTVDYTGDTYEPSGKVPLHARVSQMDDNQFVVTLYSKNAEGKESAFQETTYIRKK